MSLNPRLIGGSDLDISVLVIVAAAVTVGHACPFFYHVLLSPLPFVIKLKL